jgi:uncharacterized protein
MKYLLGLIATTMLIAVVAAAESPKNESGADMLEGVVHVNFGDAKRQEHALGNIENILNEAPDAKIEVVCHGEGISLVDTKQTKHSEKVQTLIKKGVSFAGCENTMKKQSIKSEQLVAGVTTVPSGAVEVLRKQQQGYSYFRP